MVRKKEKVKSAPPFTFCLFPFTLLPMPRYFPDAESFAKIAESADLIPVYRQILGDHLTPVTAFEVLGRDEHAFLLESVIGGERIGRYSFIATGPSLLYFVRDGKAAVVQPPGAPKE